MCKLRVINRVKNGYKIWWFIAREIGILLYTKIWENRVKFGKLWNFLMPNLLESKRVWSLKSESPLFDFLLTISASKKEAKSSPVLWVGWFFFEKSMPILLTSFFGHFSRFNRKLALKREKNEIFFAFFWNFKMYFGQVKS
mgnify:CR=1 FL=1